MPALPWFQYFRSCLNETCLRASKLSLQECTISYFLPRILPPGFWLTVLILFGRSPREPPWKVRFRMVAPNPKWGIYCIFPQHDRHYNLLIVPPLGSSDLYLKKICLQLKGNLYHCLLLPHAHEHLQSAHSLRSLIGATCRQLLIYF